MKARPRRRRSLGRRSARSRRTSFGRDRSSPGRRARPPLMARGCRSSSGASTGWSGSLSRAARCASASCRSRMPSVRLRWSRGSESRRSNQFGVRWSFHRTVCPRNSRARCPRRLRRWSSLPNSSRAGRTTTHGPCSSTPAPRGQIVSPCRRPPPMWRRSCARFPREPSVNRSPRGFRSCPPRSRGCRISR